jgi:hypothetical protein
MPKTFVTEKYRHRRFRSLRDYWRFVRSLKISDFALGRDSEKGLACGEKENGNSDKCIRDREQKKV